MRLDLLRKSWCSAQHVLIFGEAKTGKTQLMASLASKYKLLWFDLEHGVSTLFKLPLELQQNIEVISLPDTRVNPVASQTMRAVIKGDPIQVCAAHGVVNCVACAKEFGPPQAPRVPDMWNRIALNELDPNEWVVCIDGATQLGNSVMAQLCLGKPDDYKPGWDEYGPQGLMLDRFFSFIQQAKFNVVCSALVLMTEQEDKSQKLMPLCGTTNYSANVAKYFDHIIYAHMSGKKHAVGSKTTYSLQAIAGSRFDIAIEDQKSDAPTIVPFFEAARAQAAAEGTGGANQSAHAIASAANATAQLKTADATLATSPLGALAAAAAGTPKLPLAGRSLKLPGKP